MEESSVVIVPDYSNELVQSCLCLKGRKPDHNQDTGKMEARPSSHQSCIFFDSNNNENVRFQLLASKSAVIRDAMTTVGIRLLTLWQLYVDDEVGRE